MSSSFDIVAYGDAHGPGLVRLWTRFFGPWSAKRLERRWAWQFEMNPFQCDQPGGRPVILVAVANGDVVGHISGIPIPTKVGGRELPVLAASGLVVDHDHRWAGIALVRELAARAPVLATAMTGAATAILARCGVHVAKASHVRFTYPLGYAGELTIKARARLSDPLAWLASPWVCRAAASWYVPRGKEPPRPLPPRAAGPTGVVIRPITRFNETYDEFWTHVSDGLRWTVRKDAAYMNWRYLDCPTVSPVCLAAYERTDHLIGVGVAMGRAKTDRAGRPCMFMGEITELLTRDPAHAATEHLLRSLMHAIHRDSIDSIGASYMRASLHPLFERCGFDRMDASDFAAALGPERNGHSNADWGDGAACYYTAGDGDSLYSAGF